MQRILTAHEFYMQAIGDDDFLMRFIGVDEDTFIMYDDSELEEAVFNTYAQMPDKEYAEFEDELLADLD